MPLFFRLFILTFIFCSAFFASFEAACPSNLNEEEWELVVPYLLPDNHPMKAKLDYIFRSGEVLKTDQTLKKAGFKRCGARGYSKTKILKHKKLKKYLIKAFTDDQEGAPEWQIFMRRIEGAYAIRATIDRLNLHEFFRVPKKWIYQVPRMGQNPSERNFILLVEEMQIYDARGNNILWHSLAFVTEQKLTALYTIFKEVGLMDSIYIDNIPFCLDEKIAFVDTEHFHKWPVHFDKLTSNLAKKRQIFWTNLISKNP